MIIDKNPDEVTYVAIQAEVILVLQAIADQMCQAVDRLASIDNNLFTIACSR